MIGVAVNARATLLALLPFVIFVVACQKDEPSTRQFDSPASFEGSVLSTMDAGGYTYVELDTGTRTLWAAGPTTEVAVGDRVALHSRMLMRNFSSTALGRVFEEIYFTSAFEIEGAGKNAADRIHGSALPEGHPLPPTESESEVESGSIPKAENGYTIAEIWYRQEELEGQQVVVRGKVTKFLPEILHKNWIHLRDGSGDGKTAMITVTTAQIIPSGRIVLLRGKLVRNVDLGSGYRYEVMIEDASITLE